MSYFELFDLPVRFAVDGEALETAYRKVQAEVHPDRFASAPEAERRRALELATEANEAFQTLRSPVARARYLLQLRGIDTQEETNTAMPVDFLMAQMEWREAVANARAASDVEGLEQLAAAVRADRDELVAALVRSLDVTQEYDVAALGVRKLRFLDKLDQEIGDAIESLLF